VMAAAVISLLAIVCANIASILLARGHSRRAEMGIRIAMGASQRRVGWQVLTESALLAVLGLPLGILFGSMCAETVANLRPALPQNWVLLRGTDLLAGASLSPDFRVLAFAAIVAGLATLVFGVGPAVGASRVDAARLITSSGDLHASPPMRGRQFLVISQVTLATILLVSAGLMARSLGALLKTDLGFQPDGVVALHVMSTDTSASARIRRQELMHRIARIPGVSSIAMSGCVPFDLSCMVSAGVRMVGNTDASARPVDVDLHWVSTGYFQVMRVRMAAGRGFVDEDSTDGRGHVVISESAARRLFGTMSVLGRQITLDGGGGRPLDIVGVASDMKFKSVEAAAGPAIYFFSGESAQEPRFASTLFVRTDLPSNIAIATITREIRLSGAPMSVADSRPLADVVRAETSSTRFVATLLIAFATAALLLAGLGIYGVIAYMVSQRTRELGVRILLGADGRDLLRSLVGHGVVLVAAGISLGVAIAFGASRLVSSFLFGVTAFDGATYLFVVGLVGAIGLLASLIPARRITRIDPAEALR
jgi:putative ABC transport system permease protein